MRLFILTILFAAGLFSCSTNKSTTPVETAPEVEAPVAETEAPADSVEVTASTEVVSDTTAVVVE
jgi:hypothetical protein